ncbi:MAG: hypothetical protein GOP50_01745 [Candidatus Heimdallarchaeota archaeon]|nr:hypothetical protein [Candidatus Heimdallarchaeota archaeon]
MSKIIFVINAPPLSFNKTDLYNPEFVDNRLNPYIKSIADSFFLSNHFRKDNTVYFLTEFEGDSYQIVFKGDELRFLGPSFFSAGHLLLRAKNHIIDPNSKKGKLTPGISVNKRNIKWIFEKYKESKWYQIEDFEDLAKDIKLDLTSDTCIFLFGFENIADFGGKITKLSLGSIDIDEQIIITNYMIESVK